MVLLNEFYGQGRGTVQATGIPKTRKYINVNLVLKNIQMHFQLVFLLRCLKEQRCKTRSVLIQNPAADQDVDCYALVPTIPGQCSPGFDNFNVTGGWYRIIGNDTGPLFWMNAKDHCEALSPFSHLAGIVNNKEVQPLSFSMQL